MITSKYKVIEESEE